MPTLTLTTRAMRCVFGVFVESSVASQLAELGVEARVEGSHSTCVFQDPQHVLLGWHYLKDARLMSALASPDAAEMFEGEAKHALVGERELDAGMLIVNMFSHHVWLPLVADPDPLPGGLRLAIVERGNTVRTVQIQQPGFIGRGRDAPIQIPQATISRRHVELGVDSHEGWFVRDAGSSGGYWIADRKAGSARHILYPGMVLELDAYTAVVIL